MEICTQKRENVTLHFVFLGQMQAIGRQPARAALFSVCFLSNWVVSCPSFVLLQCIRYPALLQRTALDVQVLLRVQENVWLLR